MMTTDRKIGQVTLYHYNYGSALQCFATQQLVRESGFSCVLLRRSEGNTLLRRAFYLLNAAAKMAAHPTHAGEFYGMMQARRRSALAGMMEEDIAGIQQFLQQEICSVSLSYRQMLRAAQSGEYSAFLSGSDQVWNGSWFLQDAVLFLKFAPIEKRIAWAPSFGTDRVAPYNRRRFARDIGEFRYLSVREMSGVHIIRQLTGRNAVQITDPVLQLTAHHWRELYRLRHTDSLAGPYVFSYFLNEPNDDALRCLDACLSNGLTVLAFSSSYECLKTRPGIVFMGGSPWNYLALLDSAQEVLSDSFHALAFALLFHKEVRIFRRNYMHASDQSERILSLLERMRLSDHFIQRGGETGPALSPIDFDFVDEVLRRDRAAGSAFLREALEGCCK